MPKKAKQITPSKFSRFLVTLELVLGASPKSIIYLTLIALPINFW